MNSLRGLGVCVVLAGTTFAVTQAASIDRVVLGVTGSIIIVSIFTYLASVRRYRKDRRTAGE